MKKLLFVLLSSSLLLSLFSISLAQAQNPLPTETTTLFSGSGVCAQCHDNLIDQSGTNVSPVIMWRSTMMGNAARDPLWRAKVSAEVSELPDLQAAIEEKCIKCHSPILYKQSAYDGTTWSIKDLEKNNALARLGRDGDSCTVCHQIQPGNFGSADSFSPGFEIFDIREIYGPYENPFVNPMLNNLDFLPVFAYQSTSTPQSSYIMNDSEHCATCHTLFTSYVDENNELIPDSSFPEQVPYLEWLNSDYPVQGSDKTCQGCHMPKTDTPIRISTAARGQTNPRAPFWYHHFVGGNILMPNILKNNIDPLGLTATIEHFDSTIGKAQNLLETQAVNLTAIPTITGTGLNIDVGIENLAGHKLPTALPLRRVWIHLKVTDAGGNIVFESGNWDDNGEIVGLDTGFEPHYDVIKSADQVQIYEGIMQDVSGNVTHTLLRAASFVKDNRIPPKGFTETFESYPTPYTYDDVAIVGVTDDDFNAGGSGTDTVHYEISTSSFTSPYNVLVEVCYQTVTPREVTHLSFYNTTETQLFDDLYAQPTTDKTPVILQSLNLTIQ
jgi:hypothetical protein